MKVKIDALTSWLDNVAYSHSGSQHTTINYKRNFQHFLDFIEKKTEDILADYDNSTDREFKRRYARLLRAWIGTLNREGYANLSISAIVGAVESFFKYNDLPLGHVPKARGFITYHNRDITKEEILHILSVARPRERAYFTFMAQSGLRPYTISKLRIKQLQPDLEKGTMPLKIEVPQDIAKGKYKGHFTFIGEDAVHYLKDYLKTRPNLTSESYVFVSYKKPELPLDPKVVSHIFQALAKKLRAKGLLKFEQREKGKPNQIRMYNLRKYFRKFANQAGFEFVQFWMGHVVQAGQEEHYRPKDVEFHRKIYKEKAMPFLRLEQSTPTETEKVIEDLRTQLVERNGTVRELEGRIQSTEEKLVELEKIRAILDDPVLLEALRDLKKKAETEG